MHLMKCIMYVMYRTYFFPSCNIFLYVGVSRRCKKTLARYVCAFNDKLAATGQGPFAQLKENLTNQEGITEVVAT